MCIDLHVHTTGSDGLLEPAALVRAIRAARIEVFSVTDHDSVDGLDGTRRAANVEGLTLIPGVELSAYWGTVEFHIFGYFIDPANAALRAFLRDTRNARQARLHAMLSRLQTMGMRVPADEVLGRAPNGNVGRPHLARALVERGFVGSTDEAFDRYTSFWSGCCSSRSPYRRARIGPRPGPSSTRIETGIRPDSAVLSATSRSGSPTSR